MSGKETTLPSGEDRDPIELLADSFIARFRAGERPSIDDDARKHPEFAEEIRAILPALVELERNQSSGGAATGPVERPPAECSGAAPRILGDYMIIREIGRGGMGVVYEAVQQSLGRHVALKVLPQQSLAGSSHVERFQLEARAAARLHHTNIVPVFGVGSQEGVHYYAMQFIQGQGLDEVFEELRRLRGRKTTRECAAMSERSSSSRSLAQATAHGLQTGRFGSARGSDQVESDARKGAVSPDGSATTEAGASATGLNSSPSVVSGSSAISAHAELTGTQAETQYHRSVARLAMHVAEGLAYAHSQGIVHRDIKPSNLLLDAKGTIWITDFGLAKAEGTDALTHSGDIVGTLRYMAPERFDGWSDPRSDVYAIGVTLYEMVTLQFLFPEPNRAKLIDRVMHDAPTSPRKVDRKVPRDLETIILKAIAKEPALRYASAELMAEDLRRFLADKPVLARRSSPTEQAWRWCRRNPALAATSALAIIWLVAAVVVLAISNARIASTSQALATALREKDGALRTARENETLATTSEAQARAAVDQFLTRVTEDSLLKAPGLQALRRDLLRSALKFYDEFLKERSNDPGLRSALAGVHLRVGKILQDLGDNAGGKKSFEAARAIYHALAQQKTDDVETQFALAECQLRLNASSEAIALCENLLKRDPANRAYRRGLADAYNSHATGLREESELADVLEAHRKALALREGLVREFPDDPEAHNDLGGTLNNLGVVLERMGHRREALAMYHRAVEQGEAACASAPNSILYSLYLATQIRNVGRMLQATGTHDEAMQTGRKEIEHLRRLARQNPEIPIFRARLSSQYLDLARFLVAHGRKLDAAEFFGLAVLTLEDQPQKTSGDLYNLACYRGLAADAIGARQGNLTAAETRERDRLIAAAMDALRQSIESGSQSAAQMLADEGLAILRGRRDFQALFARAKADEEMLARKRESGVLAGEVKGPSGRRGGAGEDAEPRAPRSPPSRRPGRQPARGRPDPGRPRSIRRGGEDLEPSPRRS